MFVRLALGISTLLIVMLLLIVSAFGASGNLMTLERFRAHTHEARVYMVLGALNVTNSVDLSCPVPVTVGELEASLMSRQLPLEKAWVETMVELMGERGCSISGENVKPNA